MTVRVNDRGPFVRGRVVDLSKTMQSRTLRILLPVTDIDYFTRVVLNERQHQRPDALETELAGLIQQILDEIRDARARVTGNDATERKIEGSR